METELSVQERLNYMKQLDLTQTSLGSWCQIGHPANAEILARAGFEWITADCEHGEFSEEDIPNFCRAVRNYDVVPLVRVRENSTLAIRRSLDLGATGVIVPLVNSAEQAEQAVKAAHYPPDGIRGFAWHRGNDWGTEFDAYARDFTPLVFVMIESKTAVENADDIMSVNGVDGCFVGPYDMSGSYGIVGQTDHQMIQKACNKVAVACERHEKAAGRHIVTPTKEKLETAREQGFSLLALGMDTHFLADGAKRALRDAGCKDAEKQKCKGMQNGMDA